MINQIIINGIILGSTYALIALGITLIFGIMKIINFAHGQMYMIGTFMTYYTCRVYGYNFLTALLVSIVVLAILGAVLERFFFRPVLSSAKREEVTMLLSIGTAILIEQFALGLFGEKYRGVVPIVSSVYNIFNIYLSMQRVLIFLIATLAIIIFLILMQYTKTGRALRALAQDREVTYLMGVNVDKVSMIGFAIGAALAGISGAVLALIYPIYSGSGTAISVKAFTMIMIGGAGVIPGAIIGGFILGMLESIGYGLLGGSSTYLIIYSAVIIFLIFKPNGIMGKPWG
jgi:branched-chain amino acid transport system permease protein